MKIKSLQFKNFASYGNRIQSIKFNDEYSDLYLVMGANGSGKSSLSKVITYLCYGKVEGSNLKDLPNRVNKELWGRVILESKGNIIEIERGINPNIFNVKINGENHDIAGKGNLQDVLENEMFEIPYQVFKNVIILSVNDFKSFITMSPYDKKMIIDRIFGFSVINEMRELVKNKRKVIIEQIKTLDDEIRTLDDSIQSITNKIDEIEKLNEEHSTKKIADLKEKLLELNKGRKKLLDANEKAKLKISEYDKESKNINRKETEINNDIKYTKKWLKLYENKTCPTCNSSLDSKFHKNVKKTKEDHLKLLLSQYEDVKNSVISADNKLIELRSVGRQISVKVGQLETQMKNLKDEIVKLADRESKDSDYFKQLVQEFNEKRSTKSDDKLNIEGDDYYLTLLENILGDDGIKNLAIRSILPSFNSHIDIMAKEIGIPFSLRFDDKFNCAIYHLGKEISAKTLSTGERKKADFVIIMAMIKMIKVRFPSLNILFLDEIFSSIDASGVYHIISILHKTIRDVGLNTFVINHTVLPSEYFDKKIEITKDAGFSEFTVETIG